ncbi:DUF2777 family protein [Evansella sp. AB-rgal1]|uniref:DUF2777 family protein n=1 Tax=Evansella sp. AB-rgal1 TaxID=3242696 RepID=UPI00359EC03B
MDRKKAKQFIGQEVLIDEGDHGQYIGILEKMITEPNKPWRALTRITGIYEYPDFDFDKLELVEPFLKEDQHHECSGQRIALLPHPFTTNYNDSVKHALKEKWDEVQQINQDSEIILSLIQQELRRLHAEHLVFEDSYEYYQLVKKGRKVHILDEDKRETMSIEGCPFEFEINVDGEWVQATYVSGLTFVINKNNRQKDLTHGSTIRLNKTQFDPYRILINELENASLHALEKGLQKLGIGHEHSVYCHNSLLMQLLNSFDQEQFHGVNFISYANSNNQFVVQHHYERTAKHNGKPVTFDRFEFTSDAGERVLTTYATQLSNE